MSITGKIAKKLIIGFLIISLFNIFITNFILGLGISFNLGFIDLSNLVTSILLTIVGLVEFIILYVVSVGMGSK